MHKSTLRFLLFQTFSTSQIINISFHIAMFYVRLLEAVQPASDAFLIMLDDLCLIIVQNFKPKLKRRQVLIRKVV